MSSLRVCQLHSKLLTRQTLIKLLPSSSLMIQLVRHSSVLAQLAHHHNLFMISRSEQVSTIYTPCSTDRRLESEPHRELPNIQRRNYCHSSLFTCTRTRSLSSSSRQIKCLMKECQTSISRPYPSLRLFSTTSLLCNCHKSPPELQQIQRVNPTPDPKVEEKPAESHDIDKSSTQLFRLIRTALSEDTPSPTEDKDHEHNIQRNIRPAVVGDPEVVTEKLKDLLRGVNKGNRAKLAEAITLIESKHPFKHKQAQWLLTKILSHQSKLNQLEKLKPTIRIGLSGPPGAGKSTLIESFGKMLTGLNFKVAVLAVDPSSSCTGGSILGDKTRMAQLSRDSNAYIRPTPSGGSLGGVARNTNEAIILCEAAGYDIILVETVGVGQSEIAVCDMVDMFVLIIPPAAGDELQGIKRGIVELADLVIVNKADGDLLPAARRIKAEYVSALKLLRAKHRVWSPKVLKVSALENKGMQDIWTAILEFDRKMKRSGDFVEKRKQQQKSWMWAHIEQELKYRFKKNPAMADHIAAMEQRVMAGSMAPGTAADVLLDKFLYSSQQT